jgi:WS/DGAT/MGAT family acyltransferase
MHRLNGADIQFIYAERSWRHLHTLKVLVIDPSGVPGWSVERAVADLRARLPQLDPLRWRLRKVPGRIFHPVWLDVGEVDLDRHVRVVTAPPPGDDAALAALASDVASSPLPRDRPLWELVIVEGLEGGRVALVWKIHHAIADGSASLNLIRALLDESPEAAPEAGASGGPVRADAEPTSRQLVTEAARDLAGLGRELPGMLARLVRAAVNGSRRKREGGPQPAIAFTTAETRFNWALTPNRIWAFRELPLDEMREVKDVLGGTLNDVFLAITSGALREHLLARGELPERSMSAAVPTSIRQQVTDFAWGNFPSNMFVSLATDIDDPVARYRAVAASEGAAKSWHDQREHRLMFEWMNAYPAWVSYTRFLPFLVQKVLRRPSYGLIASNVRGPSETLYHCGAPLVALHSMGPLVQELGLNVTAWSYRDRMSVSLHACREHAPDLDELADRFPTALEQLRKAAADT